MLCESCREKNAKLIREIVTEKKHSNIFLCEECEENIQNQESVSPGGRIA